MKTCRKEEHCSVAGSALLVTLWAVVMIAGFVIALVAQFDSSLQADLARNGLFRARLLSESGLSIARSPLVLPGDPVLTQTTDEGTFTAVIISEGGRININKVLESEDLPLLESLFTAWGMEISEIDPVVDALLDWVDGDDLERLAGAESDFYKEQGLEGYPPNRPFRTVEEMGNVAGMSRVEEIKPDWRNFFTVWSSGPLDVNEANEELLEIVADIAPQQAQRVVEFRLGDDGEVGTKDDGVFASLEEFRILTGIPTRKFELYQDRLSVSDSIQRIESTGKVGRFAVTLRVVVAETPQGRRTVTYVE